MWLVKKGIVELEITSELQETDIVERFDYYPKTHAIMLSLNHLYDGKSIICHINTKNWNFSAKTFEQKLKERGITDQHHIDLLSEILDNNYEMVVIIDLIEWKQLKKTRSSNHGQQDSISRSFPDWLKILVDRAKKEE